MEDLLSLDAAELKKLFAWAGRPQGSRDGYVLRRFYLDSLSDLAIRDPAAALEWFRKNLGQFPDLIDIDSKDVLISRIATQNPRLAFQISSVSGFKQQNMSHPVRLIAKAASTPEARTSTLAALYEHIATLPEEGRDRKVAAEIGIGELVKGAAREGFEPGTQWISGANFSEEELKLVARGLTYAAKRAEIGRWIDWMVETIPANDAARCTRVMFSYWCREDDQAAGNWLVNAAEGKSKNAAIVGYAQTFSYLEPENIIQWAELLPPGRNRTSTMKRIYEDWPKEDPAAKQAAENFAKKQGIK